MRAAGPTSSGVDWRTSIDEARRRLGADLICRATSIRRSASPGRGRAAGADGARRQRRPPGPHLQPRPRGATRTPIPTCSSSRRARHANGTCRRTAERDRTVTPVAGDGLRHPAHARRHRGRTTPTSAAAVRRPTEQLADLTAATTPSVASRRWPSAPRRSGPRIASGPRRRGARRVPRSCSGRSTPRRSSRTAVADARRARASTASSAWCWRRTTRRSASASTTSGCRGAAHGTASPSSAIERWAHSSRPTSTSSPPPSAGALAALPDRDTRSCSPPTRCPSGCSVRRSLSRRAARDAAAVAAASGCDLDRLGRGVAERGPHAGAVARPRHPDVIRDLAADRPRRRRAGVRRGLRRRPPRGALRPRHRGRRGAASVGLRVRPHPIASTTTRR